MVGPSHLGVNTASVACLLTLPHNKGGILSLNLKFSVWVGLAGQEASRILLALVMGMHHHAQHFFKIWVLRDSNSSSYVWATNNLPTVSSAHPAGGHFEVGALDFDLPFERTGIFLFPSWFALQSTFEEMISCSREMCRLGFFNPNLISRLNY